MCVRVSVCLSEHAILAVRAIRSITKDAIVLSIRFAAILIIIIVVTVVVPHVCVCATTNFSCKGVFNQNIWGQIPPRVCNLVLFIILCMYMIMVTVC